MRCLFSAFASLILSFFAVPAFAQVQLESVDTTMEDLLGETRGELLLASEHLDLSKLDYSLESLKDIDAWLEAVHALNAEEAGAGKAGESLTIDGRGRNTVSLAGLYLGETVRRNSNLGWSWVPFDTFIAENPAYAEHYGPDAGLDAYVLVGKQGVATPINSALKRVLNGRADSLAYVGQFLAQPVDFERAVEGYDPGPAPKVVSRELMEVESKPQLEEADKKLQNLIDSIQLTAREPWEPMPFVNAYLKPESASSPVLDRMASP